ncbi:2OG-Fe(II) oxygenase [Hydrocarboniphaga sp.]|uniref:2OG-Fe(II) oxygenase n=1 Tax=Hydrocarboniphaga sp. TaxID=2033016 RepID=UPI003D0F9F10
MSLAQRHIHAAADPGSGPLDITRLRAAAEDLRDSYQQARPFPHVVVDGLFDNSMLQSVVDEFPRADQPFWYRHIHRNSLKLALNQPQHMGPTTRALLAALNSAAFLGVLETLTGIDGLIPDPYMEGGGLHQIGARGFLGIHADFNVHKKLRLDRRLNLLLYLNQDWPASYGGELELWDRGMQAAQQRIAPLFNRMVVFNTNDDSYHGHPQPLTCPENRSRKSLALYYYTAGRPESERSAAHSTLYQKRSGALRRLKSLLSRG